ncbi:MAG: sensor histidine kinase [Bacteroidota bacterium]
MNQKPIKMRLEEKLSTKKTVDTAAIGTKTHSTPANYLEMLEREIWRLNNERDAACHMLHEDVVQLLVAAKNYLHEIEHVESNQVDKTVEKVEALISNAFQKILEIHQQVSNPPFDLFGLDGALEELVDNTRKFSKIVFTLNEIDPTINQIEDYQKLIIYKVFKELIRNSLQHAKAKSINAQLSLESNIVLIHYQDDGVGFYNSNRFWRTGLVQIESLLGNYNGKMYIETSPGTGFKFNGQMQIATKNAKD